MAKIGYARVSSKGQDYQGQVAALRAAGCEKIYSEKVSGKTTKDRREFTKLMKALLPGDVILVAKLDRLARSTRDLANILHDINEAGAQFVSDDRTSPKYLGEFLKAEIKKWAVPIKAANVVVE